MVVVCCLSFLTLAGCEKAGVEGKNATVQSVRFPAVMVGRWEVKSAKPTWAFDIKPDGSILEMYHIMVGEVNFTEGEAHIEKNNPRVSTEFFLAPCEAKYDPATGEVSIEVVMDYYKIQSRGAVVEGGRTDIFKGPVSKDGRTWNAGLLMSLRFEGKKPIESRKPRPIVFTRVDAQ